MTGDRAEAPFMCMRMLQEKRDGGIENVSEKAEENAQIEAQVGRAGHIDSA
jgi:hypothetical protein